ncbi:hypothetical protein D3C81_1779100 [compost metagenome]
MPALRNETSEIIGYIGLRFLCAIRTQRTDLRFIGIIHIEIGIPDPLDSARAACGKSIGILAFQDGAQLFLGSFGTSVRGFYIHNSGFLDQIGFVLCFGKDPAPQQIIVQPPGMDGCVIYGLFVKERRRSLCAQCLVLAYGDQMGGIQLLDCSI